MGYFNYFIKCIIRNLAYKITRPKVMIKLFFICILSFITFLFLHSTGYCAEWTDGEIEEVLDGLAVITGNQGVVISQLSSMGVDVDTIQKDLDSVKLSLNSINNNTSNINLNLIDLVNKVVSINSTLTELAQQQNIYYENVTVELQQLRDAIIGSESTTISVENLGSTSINVGGNVANGFTKIKIPMEYGYTYTITATYKNTSSSNIGIQYIFSDINVTDTTQSLGSSLGWGGWINANTTGQITITTRDYQKPYLYLGWGIYFSNIKVTASIEGVVDVIDRTNQEINSGIQQGNQLQEQQNQLQQEQNDFLKDDNVNTDGLEFATDDTVNPTTDGFNTLFNTVYNAFCNTSSEPLTITLPYINETFTIQPNIVSNGMQKAGLGVIVSLINSFYYFTVCLFIYKDIAKIIDNLKSGNITSDCGNVKTEVL